MITKEYTYKLAFQEKAKKLKEKTAIREMLLGSAYASNPRLSEIDKELSEVGAKLAITALSGKKEELKRLEKLASCLSAEKEAFLKRAGVNEILFDCSACSDTGYVSGKICECVKKQAAKILLTELSREMPLDKCSFESFDLKYYAEKIEGSNKNPRRRMTAILKLCKEYIINFSPDTSPNLLFLGRTGLGKTHLSLSIVSGVIEKGYSPVYCSAENLFSKIEAEKFSGEGKGTYDAVLSCDLLVIDDLGTELITSFTKSVLYNLVNTRILSGKPTIINSNLSITEILEKYGERIASRFIGNYEPHEFLGKDIRQQKLLNK